MRRILKFLCIISICISCFSCKKDQNEIICSPNSDPCNSISEVNSNFTMEEITGVIGGASERRTVTDTSFANRNIRFYALEENAQYHWTIGAEEIYDREFYRYFPEEFSSSDVHVTLRVEKDPNLDCFPNDDGLDSLTKVLSIYDVYPGDEAYFSDGGGAEKYEGIYRMADNLTGDSITVDIQIWEAYEDEDQYPVEHLKIINLTEGGYDYFAYYDTIRSNSVSRVAYRQLRMGGGNNYVGISVYKDLNEVTNLFFYPIPEIDGLPRRSFSGDKIN